MKKEEKVTVMNNRGLITRKLWCNYCWKDTGHRIVKDKIGSGIDHRCNTCNSLYIPR
jgi:hypothetical protein